MLRNKSILFVIFVFMKKVLVIDNYDSFVYNVIQLLREAVVPVGYDIVRNDKIDFSGLGELLKLIEFCKYTHPILGICLGHQAIAETFGASLYNLSRPLHGHRSVLKKVDEHDPLFEDLADPIQVGRYHSWVIDPETMPGELITSSIDEQGHIMSFYHTELPIHGIQFHPESYISDCGSGIIRNWLKMVR